MRKTLYFFSAVSLGLSILAMPASAKVQPKIVKKATVKKKAPVTAPVKKTVVKKVAKKTLGAVPKSAPSPSKPTSSVKISGAVTSVSSAAVTNFTAACKAAIKKANAFCLQVGRGCSSYSTTPKCAAANADCEARQSAAMESCPAINS